MKERYPHILDPIQVGSVLFKNRLLTAPTGLHALQGDESYPTEAVIKTFANKARGGAAAVTCHGVSLIKSNDGTHLSYDNTTNILRVDGKSAHGSTPGLGANALQALLAFLGSFHADCQKAYDVLFNDAIGLKSLADETGKLTMSPDVAEFKDGLLKITTDIRFPATLALETVTEKLDAMGVEYTIDNYQAPLYNDPNGKLISTLIGVYNSVTNKNEAPIAIGGGTYARALKCGCAFGPEICGEEATIHQANEYVTFDRIRLMSEVYYAAIKAVCSVEEPETEENAFTRIATVIKGYRKIENAENGEENVAFEAVEAETKTEAQATEPVQSNGIKLGNATITFRKK